MGRPKKVKETEKELKVEVPPIDLATVRITLIGDSPLLVNRFDEKSKQEIKDKHNKVPKTARPVRNPMEEFKRSLYPIPGRKNAYGIPAGGVKKAAVSACRFIDGIKMTQANGSFHIVNVQPGNLIEINCKKGPQLDEQTVRIGPFGRKVPMARYRAIFNLPWSVTFDVKYNSRMISPAQLINLYENAGFSVGLCEFRPEKSGSYGMFHCKKGS